MKLSVGDIVSAVGGKLIRGSLENIVTGVSTDSRTLKKGDLFVALRGETHDGHDHLGEVRRKGAAAVVVEKKIRAGAPNVIRVKDTLRALGDIAHHWRKRFPVRVVGITGSNGKTTAKDLTAAVLSKKYRVLKTEGNFNNLIGLPLTLFRLRGDEEIAVLEMGMNRFGEIGRLAEIAEPDVGLITNVGRAHLEGLGGLKGVARAKGELLDRLAPGGLAVLNRDSKFFSVLKRRARKAGARATSFGIAKDAACRARGVATDDLKGLRFEAKVGKRRARFFLPVLGRHNISNALAALAVGEYFQVPLSQMKAALGRFRLGSKRMEIVEVAGGVTIINDCYNANPDSTAAALDFLKKAPVRRRRVAVIGDMLELGPQASQAHREVGERAAASKAKFLVSVGPHARDVAGGALRGGMAPNSVFPCGTVEQALPVLRSLLRRGDLVLVKGSRGMKMERITEGLA